VCEKCIILAIAESAGIAKMLENVGMDRIPLGKCCGFEKNEEKYQEKFHKMRKKLLNFP
jgi:hypothetical protein